MVAGGEGLRRHHRLSAKAMEKTNASPNASLDAAIAPKSVAIIGASQNPNKIGGWPITHMLHYGYRGTIYPINPGRDEIQSLKSYLSLAALPSVPKLAIIAVAGEGAVAATARSARPLLRRGRKHIFGTATAG